MLLYQGLFFMPKAIKMKLISRHYNNLLEGYFNIKKPQKLLAKKNYWPTLRHNLKAILRVVMCD